MRPYVPVRVRVRAPTHACVCARVLSNCVCLIMVRAVLFGETKRRGEKKKKFCSFGSELIAWPIPIVDFTGNKRQKKMRRTLMSDPDPARSNSGLGFRSGRSELLWCNWMEVFGQCDSNSLILLVEPNEELTFCGEWAQQPHVMARRVWGPDCTNCTSDRTNSCTALAPFAQLTMFNSLVTQ